MHTFISSHFHSKIQDKSTNFLNNTKFYFEKNIKHYPPRHLLYVPRQPQGIHPGRQGTESRERGRESMPYLSKKKDGVSYKLLRYYRDSG